MKVTAKDVASRAKTSVSAVSRAFVPDSSLSKDKRADILEAARALNYSPPSVQVAARQNAGTVALVMGDVTNPFYPTLLEVLGQELFRQGRRLLLHVVPGGRDVDAVMHQVLEQKADAAIITSSTLSSTLAKTCEQQNLPVVLFNRIQQGTNISAVACDNYAGGRIIGHRMIESGRRRLVFVGGLANTSTHIERQRGFSAALDDSGLKAFATVSGGYAYDQTFAVISDLLKAREKPDALFCANDIMGLAAIDAAKAYGVRVPDDVAIIGYDDIPMAAWHSYQLTTMRQPIRYMVNDTLNLIDRIIDDPAVSGSVRLVPGKLIERASG